MSSSSIPDCINRDDPCLKYELLYELGGKGSYGSVYKAMDLKTSKLVAIKVISLAEGEKGYEEIRGEIEMLQQCSHPNVIRYLGGYQGEEYLWIVMAYCAGGSVAGLMNVTDEPLDENQIAYICREALKVEVVVYRPTILSTIDGCSNDACGLLHIATATASALLMEL